MTPLQFECFEGFLIMKQIKDIRFMVRHSRKEYNYDKNGTKEVKHTDSSYKYTNAVGLDYDGNEFELDLKGEKVQRAEKIEK